MMIAELKSLTRTARAFTILICFTSYTSCSATNKVVESEHGLSNNHSTLMSLERGPESLNHDLMREETTVETDSSAVNLSKRSNKVNSLTKNGKKVSRLEMNIDSVLSVDYTLYGLKIVERSSSVSNESDGGRVIEIVQSSDTSHRNQNLNRSLITKGSAHRDRSTVEYKANNEFNSTAKVREDSTIGSKKRPFLLKIILSWWFWLLLILSASMTWLVRKGLNPISWIKTLYNIILGKITNKKL